MAKRVLIFALVLSLVTSLGVLGAKKPAIERIKQNFDLLDTDNSAISRYLLTPKPRVLYPATGDTVGNTKADYWHNDCQRRQIARDATRQLHFFWNYTDDFIEFFSYYNSLDYTGTWLAQGGFNITGTDGAKRACSDLFPDNREVLVDRLYGSLWHSILAIEKSSPGVGSFYNYDIPDSLPGKDGAVTWPMMAISKVPDVDTNFIHITGTHTGTSGAGYVRCYEDPDALDTVWCQAPGSSLFKVKPGQRMVPRGVVYVFDPSRNNVTGLPVATSPVSRKVCVAWIKQVSSASRGEVVYHESTNNGNDWMASGNMGTLHQVTNYGADNWTNYVTPQTEITAVYDYNDVLHLVWTTGTPANSDDNTLWHWSSATGISKITSEKVVTANVPAFQHAITKMTLGVESMPLDPAYNYLYVNYSKLSDNDVADNGFPNAEVIVKASSNSGQTWGPEVNLTNTYTPGCVPPNCRSESYSSIAEAVDSFLYVMYLEDKDAGAYDYSSHEGTATLNQVRYIKYPRPLVPKVAGLVYNPTQLYDPIEWATNGGTTQDSIVFENVGTDTLFVQISGPAWATTITPDNFFILEAAPLQKVNLTFSGAGKQDTFLVDSLRIISNHGLIGGGETYVDTQWVKINFVITDTFYFAEWDTASVAGDVKIAVSNVGNLGHQEDGWMMNYNGHDYLFEFTPVFATDIPGYGHAGFTWLHEHHDFLAEDSLRKKDYPTLKTKVIYDKFYLSPFRFPSPYNWWWSWWTKYSMIVISKYDGIKTIRIYNWWRYNRIPQWWNDFAGSSVPAGGYFGIAADWDVPAEASGENAGGYDTTLSLIYQYADTAAFSNYYGGFLFIDAHVIKGIDTTYHGTKPFGAHVLTNSIQLYPYGGYNDDSLYKYMSTSGWSVASDSAQDMNTVMSIVQELNPDTSTQIALEYALLITDLGLTDLQNKSAMVKRVKAGDANVDGKVSVSDVVYLINYLFKGGTEPWLAYSDANGDAKVSVSDVVYLINYLFKGGPLPLLVWDDWEE